ncbi:hypothetical protein ACHAPU_009567 [Fusarium lateritium]
MTAGASGPPAPPPRPKMVKRQGDKIANGAAADLNAVVLTQEADLVQTDGDNSQLPIIGAQFGGDEEDILERLGNMVPSKSPTTGGVPAIPRV